MDPWAMLFVFSMLCNVALLSIVFYNYSHEV